MPTYPFPTTNLVSAPEQSSFPSGTNLLVVTPGGIIGQTPAPLLNRVDVYLNVRAFGASGDGVSDDTAAIQACFAAAVAGSTVVFPPGYTFAMTGYVTVAVNRLTVIGTGAKIISKASGQDRKFLVSGKTAIRFRDITVDGGAFTDLAAPTDFETYSPRTHPGTIHFVNSKDCSVLDSSFTGVNWPVTILGSCEGIDVINNSFSAYFAGVYSYFSDDSGQPQPKRVTVAFNRFYAGKYKAWELGTSQYDDRDYTFQDRDCSGAIKFRGEDGTAGKPWYVATYHRITGNVIRDSGQMGIEMQGLCNDSVISGNTITSVPIGISLSVMQRVVVSDNTIRDTIYTCIEVDGWVDAGPTDESNDEIALTGNVLDGRDDFGRPVNFVNNYGIVVSHRSRNVTITGGVIKYHKTAIAVIQNSEKVVISGVRIVTNKESGTGDLGLYVPVPTQPYVQGILLKDTKDVEIIGCVLEPLDTAWQRMVNIINGTNVRIRACTITSQNSCVYIHNSSGVTVEGGELIMGATPGGTNISFIAVDSTNYDCADLIVRGVKMSGTVESGVSIYCPANTVGPILLDGNDTRFAVCTGTAFVNTNVTGTGALGQIITRNNVGTGNSEQSNIDVAMKVVDGNAGPFTDTPVYSTLVCQWVAVVNLQTAVGFSGKTKTIVQSTAASSVTIHPRTGQKINGVTGDVVITGQWDRVTLKSDGTDWVVVDASPCVAFPIVDVVAKASLKVNGNSNGVALKQIASVVVTHDFGTIAATDEVSIGGAVDCNTGTTNRPVAMVGWIDYMASPVFCRQVYIDSTNHWTARFYNPAGTGIAVGSVTFRILVFEPVAP